MGKITGNIRRNGDYVIRGVPGDSASLIFAGGFGGSCVKLDVEKNSNGYQITVTCFRSEADFSKYASGSEHGSGVIGNLEIIVDTFGKIVSINCQGFELKYNSEEKKH